MKKIIAILLLCTTFYAYSETATPEPYKKDEFLPELQYARRASIIFCGAFPLGYMYATAFLDPVLASLATTNTADPDSEKNKQVEIKLAASLLFATIVMIIDLIIENFIKG